MLSSSIRNLENNIGLFPLKTDTRHGIRVKTECDERAKRGTNIVCVCVYKSYREGGSNLMLFSASP